MEKDQAQQQPELAQSRESTEPTEAGSELPDKQLDHVAGGLNFTKIEVDR